MGHLTVVCLLKCRISVEVPSVDKAKMQCRERFNITTKLHIGPIKKIQGITAAFSWTLSASQS